MSNNSTVFFYSSNNSTNGGEFYQRVTVENRPSSNSIVFYAILNCDS